MANSNLPPGSTGTIPVALAKEQVKNWEDYIALETTDLKAKSFLFDLSVVNNLAATAGANGMRVYPALKTSGDPSSVTLLLVPTADGKDIVPVPINAGALGGDDDDSNIYNYASTCPPVCQPPGDTFTTM